MLVLKQFQVDESAETFLTIKGRQEGVIAWILSKVGLDPTTEMVCNRREVVYKSSSARHGQQNINIPNTAVTAVVTGYTKPFPLLVMAAVFALSGIITAASQGAAWFIVGLIIAGICLIAYALNKEMFFGVYNGGDKCIASLTTKRSVIEGVNVDFDKFEKAATLLTRVVLESTAAMSKR